MRNKELGMMNTQRSWREQSGARSVMLGVVMFLALCVMPGFAQELKLSGEAKSGIFWEETQYEGQDKKAEVKLHSKDDAGGGQGRYRLNLDYDNGNNFGMRARLQWETFTNTTPDWSYAFGYGNFFDNQLTVSVGRLGGSPWGTGGPEMWKELEETRTGGMRTEWKPAFVPGQLNVGFVLNYFNTDRDQGSTDTPISLLNILEESIIGASYTNDYFHARIAYRFDSEMDAIQGVGKQLANGESAGGRGEDELVYRFEEKVIGNSLPGFQIWALGHWFGVTAKIAEMKYFRNWLFVQYAPEQFTSQVRVGYNYIENRSEFYVKPSFYYNLFDKLISVGAMFQYCQDFGKKVYEGSPFQYIEVEPKIQFNFTSSYVAFAYNWKREYTNETGNIKPGKEPLKQTQWMNLRFCIYF